MWLAGFALSKGMRIKYSEGLIKDNNAIAGVTERGVCEALGLSCQLPSEREIAQDKPTWRPQQN
jgi:DNA polymerase/3'-5' exonuclease PolX